MSENRPPVTGCTFLSFRLGFKKNHLSVRNSVCHCLVLVTLVLSLMIGLDDYFSLAVFLRYEKLLKKYFQQQDLTRNVTLNMIPTSLPLSLYYILLAVARLCWCLPTSGLWFYLPTRLSGRLRIY